MNGTDLLTDFKENRSEAAFAELVCRYANLVYSVAMRRLSNATQAEEVTQTVFIRLAAAVPTLRADAELLAWLHRTATHVSIDLWRSESRRRTREEHAAAMQLEPSEEAAWNELSPVLDEVLNELNDSDRRAILIRYFDDKTMRDLGVLLGVSEDAAKMRLNRALNKLRNRLAGRGIACGAVALGAMLEKRAVEAAPAGLDTSLAAFQFSVAAGGGAGSGIFGAASQIFKTKLAAGLAVLLIGGAAILLFARFQSASNRPIEADSGQTLPSNAAHSGEASTSVISEMNKTDAQGEPNPLKLLQAIAQARQQISSGEIEFEVAHYEFDRPLDGTNYVQIKAQFDGEKLRFGFTDREYRYVVRGDNVAEETEAKRKELGLDRDASVAAGLLEGFEAQHVKTYDGTILMDYWTHDGKRFQTDIQDPAKGGGSYVFDPRTFGITGSFSLGGTASACLGLQQSNSVKVIGKESIDGIEAWHVYVERKSQSKSDSWIMKSDFWIDIGHPLHVIKFVSNWGPSVNSVFDSSHPEDILPVEVTCRYFNGRKTPVYELKARRGKTRFDVSFDPSVWTLAGLKMQVGTEVNDDRIMRGIGYWTGTGLSADMPARNAVKEKNAPNLSEMLALLETDPASPSALEAAIWIILNTPDGPAVEKAAEVIIREHIQNPDLGYFAQELERVRPRSSGKLLGTLMENNPNVEVRAIACFTLATIRKDESEHGLKPKAAVEAEKLFEKVVTEYSGTGPKGTELARKVKPELYELRNVSLGKPAPGIDAETLDGRRISLNDYKGKVVVLVFWSHSYSEISDHQKLVDHVTGKPFALIGINCDRNLTTAKSLVEKYNITWPTVWDGDAGPISKAWNINSWTSVLVLDRKGIIRFRDARDTDLVKTVDALLNE